MYIGETKRTLSQRFEEHANLDKPTGVGDHCRATGHSVSMKNTKILTRESNWHKRKVKEAIYIRQRAPTMHRDQGYHLPAIYNQIIPPKSEATHVTHAKHTLLSVKLLFLISIYHFCVTVFKGNYCWYGQR